MKLKRARILMFLSIICLTVTFMYGQTTDSIEPERRKPTNWYVMETGNDSNDGKSEMSPFKTLAKAEQVVGPGDVVLIGNGIYSGDGLAVLEIKVSGTEDAWITWKALSDHAPEIHPKGWNGILITGSYHIFDGLRVIGQNDYLTLVDAEEDGKKEKSSAKYNTNGIFVNGRNNTAAEKPHHVIIRNCTVAKCPGGGIVGIETDYLTVEDNKVYDNSWYTRYASSGITTLNNWAFDEKEGYHIIIQRNYVWNNKTLVPWERIGKISDGNGIILDVTDHALNGATNPNDDSSVKESDKNTVPKSIRPVWKGRALIANNLSAYNGGSGIHTFRTKHVDIFNNTTYSNGMITGYQELFPNTSEDIVIKNNIIVPKPGGKVTSNNKNANIIWDYNMYPEAQDVFNGPNDIVSNPDFKEISLILTNGDFRLNSGSPGLNSGTSDIVLDLDINGNKRPKGKGMDRGAFEVN